MIIRTMEQMQKSLSTMRRISKLLRSGVLTRADFQWLREILDDEAKKIADGADETRK